MWYNIQQQQTTNAPAMLSTSGRVRHSEVNTMPDKTIPLVKHCSKCDNEYPNTFEYFRRLHGKPSQPCKPCHNKINREKLAEKYWNDPEKYRAKSRNRHFSNREESNAVSLAYYYSHRNERLKKAQKWKAEHREEIRAYDRGPGSRTKTLRRRARKQSLPSSFSAQDWGRCLKYFNNRCVACGRPAGLWHTLAMDHWIPLSSPDCPGTIPTNILPLCHGLKDGKNGCNTSKSNRDPREWLVSKFGPRKAKQILKRIDVYFAWVKGSNPT